jgi:hypothetical protein
MASITLNNNNKSANIVTNQQGTMTVTAINCQNNHRLMISSYGEVEIAANAVNQNIPDIDPLRKYFLTLMTGGLGGSLQINY